LSLPCHGGLAYTESTHLLPCIVVIALLLPLNFGILTQTKYGHFHTAVFTRSSTHASFLRNPTLFTARRYASAVCAVIVCLSVRPSVTGRSSTKTVKPTITQTTPYDGFGNLVYCCKIYRRNSNGVTFNVGV